jgi:hypothetical protein
MPPEFVPKSYQAQLEALRTQERRPRFPKWEREVGDTIVAKVLERTRLNGKYGESDRLILEVVDASTEGGRPLEKGEQRSLSCSSAVLVDWVEDENPQPGDVVAIYFADKVPSAAGGQPWHDLRATVLERGGDIPF